MLISGLTLKLLERMEAEMGRGMLKKTGSVGLAVILMSAGLFAGAAYAAGRSPVGEEGGQAQGAAVLKVLNRQRAANGIPGFTTDQQDYASSWCPNEGAHFETNEWGEDLSPSTTWNASTTPYEGAPLHQQDLYNPLFTVMGDVDRQGQDCFGAGGPAAEPSTPHFYSFIQPTGPHAVPTSETADEFPFTPGQLVGIRRGTKTGPYIILFATGLPGECGYCASASSSAEIASYSLKRAGGARVSGVKMVDPGIADKHAKSAGYLFGDVSYLIPPKLPRATAFTGRVVWSAPDGQRYTQRLSFTTAARR